MTQVPRWPRAETQTNASIPHQVPNYLILFQPDALPLTVEHKLTEKYTEENCTLITNIGMAAYLQQSNIN